MVFVVQHFDRVLFRVNRRIQGYCWITFPNGAEDAINCIVDTGAAVTTIPQAFWSASITKDCVAPFAKERPITTFGGELPALEIDLPLEISGSKALTDKPYALGKTRILLALDDDNNRPMKYAILGVGGALEKGGLCVNWKTKHAHYVEV